MSSAKALTFKHLYQTAAVKQNTVTVFGESSKPFEEGTDYDEEIIFHVKKNYLSAFILYYNGVMQNGQVGSQNLNSLRNVNGQVQNIPDWDADTEYYLGDTVMFYKYANPDPETDPNNWVISNTKSVWTCVAVSSNPFDPLPDAGSAGPSYNGGVIGRNQFFQQFIKRVPPQNYASPTGVNQSAWALRDKYWRESTLATGYNKNGLYYDGDLTISNGIVYECIATNGLLDPLESVLKVSSVAESPNNPIYNPNGKFYGYDEKGLRYIRGIQPGGGTTASVFWEPSSLPAIPMSTYTYLNFDHAAIAEKIHRYDGVDAGGFLGLESVSGLPSGTQPPTATSNGSGGIEYNGKVTVTATVTTAANDGGENALFEPIIVVLGEPGSEKTYVRGFKRIRHGRNYTKQPTVTLEARNSSGTPVSANGTPVVLRGVLSTANGGLFGGRLAIPFTYFNDDEATRIKTLRAIYDENERDFSLIQAQTILAKIPAVAIKSQKVGRSCEPDMDLDQMIRAGPTFTCPEKYRPAVQGLFETALYNDMLYTYKQVPGQNGGPPVWVETLNGIPVASEPELMADLEVVKSGSTTAWAKGVAAMGIASAKFSVKPRSTGYYASDYIVFNTPKNGRPAEGRIQRDALGNISDVIQIDDPGSGYTKDDPPMIKVYEVVPRAGGGTDSVELTAARLGAVTMKIVGVDLTSRGGYYSDLQAGTAQVNGIPYVSEAAISQANFPLSSSEVTLKEGLLGQTISFAPHPVTEGFEGDVATGIIALEFTAPADPTGTPAIGQATFDPTTKALIDMYITNSGSKYNLLVDRPTLKVVNCPSTTFVNGQSLNPNNTPNFTATIPQGLLFTNDDLVVRDGFIGGTSGTNNTLVTVPSHPLTSDFTDGDTVTFNTPSGGMAAEGTITVNATTREITGITLTNGGGGYTSGSTFTVSVSSSGGSPQYNNQLYSGGPMTLFSSSDVVLTTGISAVVVAPSSNTAGFANNDPITFSDPSGTGTAAAGIVESVDVSGKILTITITSPGSGYLPSDVITASIASTGSSPTINGVAYTSGSTIPDGDLFASANVVRTTYIESVSFTPKQRTEGFTTGQLAIFTAPSGGRAAKAVVVADATTGAITGFSFNSTAYPDLPDPGYGYDTPFLDSVGFTVTQAPATRGGVGAPVVGAKVNGIAYNGASITGLVTSADFAIQDGLIMDVTIRNGQRSSGFTDNSVVTFTAPSGGVSAVGKLKTKNFIVRAGDLSASPPVPAIIQSGVIDSIEITTVGEDYTDGFVDLTTGSLEFSINTGSSTTPQFNGSAYTSGTLLSTVDDLYPTEAIVLKKGILSVTPSTANKTIGFRADQPVRFLAPSGGRAAMGTLSIDTSGKITGITMTSFGYGYDVVGGVLKSGETAGSPSTTISVNTDSSSTVKLYIQGTTTASASPPGAPTGTIPLTTDPDYATKMTDWRQSQPSGTRALPIGAAGGPQLLAPVLPADPTYGYLTPRRQPGEILYNPAPRKPNNSTPIVTFQTSLNNFVIDTTRKGAGYTRAPLAYVVGDGTVPEISVNMGMTDVFVVSGGDDLSQSEAENISFTVTKDTADPNTVAVDASITVEKKKYFKSVSVSGNTTSGFRNKDKIVFAPPLAVNTEASTAEGYLQVNSAGSITGIVLTRSGFGYDASEVTSSSFTMHIVTSSSNAKLSNSTGTYTSGTAFNRLAAGFSSGFITLDNAPVMAYGYVDEITLPANNTSYGFTSADTVTFSSPSRPGRAATGELVLNNANGSIIDIRITDPGYGYTAGDVIGIRINNRNGLGHFSIASDDVPSNLFNVEFATITKKYTILASDGYSSMITGIVPGRGYGRAPEVKIRFNGVESSSTLLESRLGVVSLTKTTNGANMYSNLTMLFEAPPASQQAQAVARISQSGGQGVVSSVAVTLPGSGYVAKPKVRISGYGAGATGKARMKIVDGIVMSKLAITSYALGDRVYFSASLPTGGHAGFRAVVTSYDASSTTVQTVYVESDPSTEADLNTYLETGKFSALTWTQDNNLSTNKYGVNFINASSGGGGSPLLRVKPLLGVASVDVITGGAGYVNIPVVAIDPPPNTTRTAKATAKTAKIADNSNALILKTRGDGYQVGDKCRLTGAVMQVNPDPEDYAWIEIKAIQGSGSTGPIASFELTTPPTTVTGYPDARKGGSNYRPADVLKVESGSVSNLGSGATIYVAEVTSSVVTGSLPSTHLVYDPNAPEHSDVTLLDGGQGYLLAPALTILPGDQNIKLSTSLRLDAIEVRGDYLPGYTEGEDVFAYTVGNPQERVGSLRTEGTGAARRWVVQIENHVKNLPRVPEITSRSHGTLAPANRLQFVPSLNVDRVFVTSSIDGFRGGAYVWVESPNGPYSLLETANIKPLKFREIQSITNVSDEKEYAVGVVPRIAITGPNLDETLAEVQAGTTDGDSLRPSKPGTHPDPLTGEYNQTLAPYSQIPHFEGWYGVVFNENDRFEFIVQYTIAKALAFEVDTDETLPGLHFAAESITLGGVTIPLFNRAKGTGSGREMSTNKIVRRYKVVFKAIE